jgi:hypothetical protein
LEEEVIIEQIWDREKKSWGFDTKWEYGAGWQASRTAPFGVG